MQMFDGKKHALLLEEKIKDFLKAHKKVKTLAIIQVGENTASEKYIYLKEQLCEKFKISVEIHKFSENEGFASLRLYILDITTRGHIGGIIIQLPLPQESFYKLLDLIPAEKDIDVLSSTKRRMFKQNKISLPAPVVRACEYFISSNNINIKNAKCVIVGEGMLVGKPLKRYLKSNGARTLVVNDYKTRIKLDGELVVLSVGVSNLVKGEDIAKGANVIDFGSSVVDGRTVGDLNMSSRLEHLNIISPSPGGMGPLVVRFLIMNHLGI